MQTFVQTGFGDLNNAQISSLVKWICNLSKAIQVKRKWTKRENNNVKAHRKTSRIQVYFSLKEMDCKVAKLSKC